MDYEPLEFQVWLPLDGEMARRVRVEWLEDELTPRVFTITESDHPYVWRGDKVVIVASGERPQG